MLAFKAVYLSLAWQNLARNIFFDSLILKLRKFDAYFDAKLQKVATFDVKKLQRRIFLVNFLTDQEIW